MRSSLRMSAKKSRRRGKTKAKRQETSSVEEVVIPLSFKDVLSNKTLRGKFRDFLNKRVAIECLNFYEAIELFEKITIHSARQKAGRHILDEYLEENARYWVNIPGELRCNLLLLEEFHADSFAAAKLAVENLMSVNFFQEFKQKLQNNEAKCNAPTLSFENKHVYRESSFEDLSQTFSSDLMMSLRSKEDESVPLTPPPADSFGVKGKGRLGGSMRASKRHSATPKKGKLSTTSGFGSSMSLFRRKGIKKSYQGQDAKPDRQRLEHLNTDIWKEVENEHEVTFDFDF